MTTTTQSPKDAALSKAWAAIKQGTPKDAMGLPSKTWAAIPLRTRAVLVMLGATSMDDPREVARRPWASLSDADREGIGAVAREVAHNLKNAACLF